MKRYTPHDNSTLSKVLGFMLFILDYIYSELASIPRDLISEIHLRFGQQNRNPKMKILGYWDFHQRLAKFGDFLIFLEVLSVLRLQYRLDENVKNIDLCFIDDSAHHNAKNKRYQKSYFWKKSLMALAATNPWVDSVFLFHPNAEFERFYQQNRDRYFRWPPTLSSTIPSDCRILEKFYAQRGSLPQLSLPSEMMKTIQHFLQQHVSPALPIAVNVRQSAHWGERNTNLDELKKFLKHFEADHRYKFITICNKEEIPKDFRELSNVIFSKDYFQDIEFDLALIKASYLSIFPSSGMACFAWFSNTPFIQYGPHGHDKYTFPRGKEPFNFFQKHQQHYRQALEAPWLIATFEQLAGYVSNIKKSS